MDTATLQHGLDAIWEVVRPFVTSLVQISWQALPLSCLLVLPGAILHFLKKGTYSRLRFGLLLAATLVPFLLCLWTWIAGYMSSQHYEAPFLLRSVHTQVTAHNPLPERLEFSTAVEEAVIWTYCCWLILYPVVLLIKALPVYRLLRAHDDDEPRWIKTTEPLPQEAIWQDLLNRFWLRDRVRIIEIENMAPMTVGYLRPVVVVPGGIPAESMGLNDDNALRAVLAHELAHIRYHSSWMMIHRIAGWLFPVSGLPIWLFDCLRKRFLRLQTDTEQAAALVAEGAGEKIGRAGRTPILSRCFDGMIARVRALPDPGAIMDVEFELHADSVAVRVGGADSFTLRKTLLQVTLYDLQEQELLGLVEKIRTEADLQRVIAKLEKKMGLFGASHVRFRELPPDPGVSLWAKVVAVICSFGTTCPIAIPLIPALIFLAKNGSELTSLPPAGFAQGGTKPAAMRVVSEPKAAAPIVVASAPPQTPKPVRTPKKKQRTVREVPESMPRVANTSTPYNNGMASIPSVRPISSTPISTPAADPFQRVAALNEEQRILQDTSQHEQRADEAFRRGMNAANVSRQINESATRGQNQAQAAERARQTAFNSPKAGDLTQRNIQQADRTTRNIEAQTRMNRQADALAIQTAQNIQRQSQQQAMLNNVRPAITPNIPPAVVTTPRTYSPPPSSYSYTPPPTVVQPRTYTPPLSVNTYTPPRTFTPPTVTQPRIYNPPAILTQPRIYTPPPMPYTPPRTYTPPSAPYIPPPAPRIH